MLRLQNISKSFSGVKAVQDISMQFNAGEVHALCGENGAGKSTLMNIIAGNLQPDEGSLYWNGELFQNAIPVAQKKGIAIVHQERTLVDSLSVAENIYPVHKPKNAFGFIDYTVLYAQTKALLQTLNLQDIAPQKNVGALATPQKQMVEIAKALAAKPALLILDEPTASITTKETETLFRIINHLKAQGVAVIYISHRMDEIKKIADVVSVLKDGTFQGTVNAKVTPTEKIIGMMVGRDLQQATFLSHVQKEIKLKVQSISGRGFHQVSFDLHKGEILGFAGLLGAGRSALAKALFGDEPILSGTIEKDGKQLFIHHPEEAIKAGIAYIPEERKNEGLFLEKTLAENIVAASLKGNSYNPKSNELIAIKYCTDLNIKTPGVQQMVQNLSGGNQQKVVLAKWLLTAPDVLIVNEPTHGVDVGAKAEIYKLLKALTAEGKSILLISSELTELLLLCDRIGVMYGGKLNAILPKSEATEEKLTALASGL